ncbi:MAG: efflux RND transporter periplasmic adaptor subunit [Hyphomicrobiales bacterium]|nr:efflux RND transporter periplasmic adaptor subunit [Hyphomicrobiales bacterium]
MFRLLASALSRPLAATALALVVTAGFAPALLAQGTGGATPAAPRAPSISVVKVERAEVISAILVSGTIIAREEVLVAAEIDGLAITEILAEEGDSVQAGQILLRLNRAALDVLLAQNTASLQRNAAAIAQARAQIAEAEANKLQANNALSRAQTLRTDGITSADTFDQRLAASRGADARLVSARQALVSAEADQALTTAQRGDIELRIRRSEIKAPRAGVISRRNARQGAIASMAAAEPLFRIIADGAVELEAEVPEADMPRVAIGKPVKVTPAGALQPITGQVRLISPEVDRQTRLGKVRIALPAASTSAVGAFGRGVIEIDRRVGLTVPVSAVTYRRDSAVIQVVEGTTVRSRVVKLGLSGQGRVEILEGIQDGDLVVARAGTFLRDGDVITPVPTPTPSKAMALN